MKTDEDSSKSFGPGKRRYVCKSFQVDCAGRYSVQPAFALLLERGTAASSGLAEITAQFDLTQRERETVEYLLQGLTSKEIATRMGISPNTVKAFLRLVMVKMKVSTRSGIAGKDRGLKAKRLNLVHLALAAAISPIADFTGLPTFRHDALL